MTLSALLSIALATPGFIYQIQSQPTSQTTTAQQSTAPCTVTTTAKAPAGQQQQVQLSADAKKFISQKQAWLQKFSPVTLPDATKIPAPAKQALPPCPPAQPITQAPPAAKPPADITVSIRCNPLVPSPKGVSGGTTGFTLPDPHLYGVPDQPNQFEADNATPDVAAKTPCYALKVDPKTNKYFIAAQ